MAAETSQTGRMQQVEQLLITISFVQQFGDRKAHHGPVPPATALIRIRSNLLHRVTHMSGAGLRGTAILWCSFASLGSRPSCAPCRAIYERITNQAGNNAMCASWCLSIATSTIAGRGWHPAGLRLTAVHKFTAKERRTRRVLIQALFFASCASSRCRISVYARM